MSTQKFPFMKDGFPHGSIEDGRRYLEKMFTLPMPIKMERLIRELLRTYAKLGALESEITMTRRSLAFSEGIQGDKSDKPRKTRSDLLDKVYEMELRLYDLVESRDETLEKECIDKNLARVMKQCSTFELYARMGDYLAILQQEVKMHPELFDFKFNEFQYVADLVIAIDKELELKSSAATEIIKPKTPVLDALQKVADFFGSPYKDIMDIIEMFRRYSTRNRMVHNGAKSDYDRGDFAALHETMVTDRDGIELYGFSEEQKSMFLTTLENIEKSFYNYFSWKPSDGYILNSRGEQLAEKFFSLPTSIDGKLVHLPLPSKTQTAKKRREDRKARQSHEENLSRYKEQISISRVEADFQIVLINLKAFRTDHSDENLDKLDKSILVVQEAGDELLQRISDLEEERKTQQNVIESQQKTIKSLEEKLAQEQKSFKKLLNVQKKGELNDSASGELDDAFGGISLSN